MEFTDYERPLGIQIFGNNANSMILAAQIAEKENPDFIDINWGCPVKKIASKGSGSGILNDIPKMIDISSQVVKACKLERAETDPAAIRRFTRRLFILLLIGLVHLMFWMGDILFLYAATGFLLIPFRKAPTKTLLKAALFFWTCMLSTLVRSQ